MDFQTTGRFGQGTITKEVRDLYCWIKNVQYGVREEDYLEYTGSQQYLNSIIMTQTLPSDAYNWNYSGTTNWNYTYVPLSAELFLYVILEPYFTTYFF